MTKQLKKGDRVIYFRDWDEKGTCAWAEWIVDSAGAKQIHLRAADGSMRKHRVYTSYMDGLLLASEVQDVEQKALEFAAQYLSRWIKHHEDRIAGHLRTHATATAENDGYIRAMQRGLDNLRKCEPQTINRAC